MYFPKLNWDKDALDLAIMSIELEYGQCSRTKMATLISKNFDKKFEDVLLALQANDAQIVEDYEKESAKQLNW